MKMNFQTEFVSAARDGDAAKFKEKFQEISLREEKNEQIYFALYFAAFNGNIEIVRFLMECNVNPNFTVGTFLTPLHAAIFKKNHDIVEILLNNNAIVEPKIRLESGEEINYFCSPLIAAVFTKDGKLVDTLLKKGANINAKLLAVEEEKLKDFMANNKKGGNSSKNILNFGTFKYYDLTAKSNSFSIAGSSVLHLAIKSGNENIIKNVLDQEGIDLNPKSCNDLTPLSLTCHGGNLALAKILLKAGADVNCTVDNGKQILGYCLKWLHDNYLNKFSYYKYDKMEWIELNKLFSYFLKFGANPNGWSTGKRGTVLHYAASKGMAHSVHILLKHGANPNVADGNNKTPLEYSISNLLKRLDRIQRLFSFTAHVDDFDRRISEERLAEREADRKREYENRKIYNLTHNTYTYNVVQYISHYADDGGFNTVRDPVPNRMVAQLLTRELVRMEELGTRIIQQNRKILESTFVKPYYTRCKNELKKLKKTKIIDGLSYYDFLFASEEKLAEYMENENIVSEFNEGNYCRLFPNYKRNLKLNVKRGLKRNRDDDDDEDSTGSSDDEVRNSTQMRNTIIKFWRSYEDM
ncbi:putative ankyrin repeat protein RF_0381 [Leptopilina heterotoma]|uniref:putative ankyrin repeat protein RF_0381 n=1 Tax=Leptopilina heterotoma TaxID=63436 RepID=UPI001CA92CBD|nr:putative ankyrin repeat protein RF_0381 [Leptopilina heterotoma]XP_043465841.1 putative ankyrin repeat protein RF_0381 [Leptopilina heterotoma]XP_043465842.1 putative ankyrin repeat protein RF_0381 [Leptopilina heterotoma]